MAERPTCATPEAFTADTPNDLFVVGYSEGQPPILGHVNRDFTRMFGLAGGTVHHLISRLSALGMIEVEYTANGKQRRVVIKDTGARTQWSAPHAVSPTARQRGPKPGTRAPGFAFQIMSDASLYGSHADDVREARRRGYEVVKAVTPGWFRVAGRVVDGDRLRAIAARRARP